MERPGSGINISNLLLYLRFLSDYQSPICDDDNLNFVHVYMDPDILMFILTWHKRDRECAEALDIP